MHARELENAQRLCKEETSGGNGEIAESAKRAAKSGICSAGAGSGGCSGCTTGSARGGTSRGGGSQRADRHRCQGCVGVSWDCDRDGGVAGRIGWYNHGCGGHNRGRSNTGDDWRAHNGN